MAEIKLLQFSKQADAMKRDSISDFNFKINFVIASHCVPVCKFLYKSKRFMRSDDVISIFKYGGR